MAKPVIIVRIEVSEKHEPPLEDPVEVAEQVFDTEPFTVLDAEWEIV